MHSGAQCLGRAKTMKWKKGNNDDREEDAHKDVDKDEGMKRDEVMEDYKFDSLSRMK